MVTEPQIDKWGNQAWYNDEGQRHRVDGPAWIGFTGLLVYYQHGVKHRLDGPAKIWPNGSVEYWVNGKHPISIMDFLIIREEIDHEMFPSAILHGEPCLPYRAYRLDSVELTLAILRYS